MKAICFFDIDDTLVPFGEEEIRPDVKQVLMKLKEKDCAVFINSGRTKSFLPPFIKAFPFTGLALGCGTYIEINHSITHFFEFDKETCQLLIEDLQKYHLSAVFEGHEANAFLGEDIHPVMKELHITYASLKAPIANILDPTYRFSKFGLFSLNRESAYPFLEKYKNILEFIPRKENFYEVVPKKYSKATAVKQVASKLNVPISECYCFGDSTNDLSMLEAVKHSIVMENGDKAVKEIAELVTHDTKQDGIEYACKHYHLI